MEFSKEKQNALKKVKWNGHNLKDLKEFQDDEEVVIVAVQNDALANGNETALSFASERLRNNDRVVFEALKNAGLTLADANPRFQNDERYITLAVQQEPAAIRYASKEKQNDPVFLAKLAKECPKVVKFIENKDIRAQLTQQNTKKR